jgi:hypothetical protein
MAPPISDADEPLLDFASISTHESAQRDVNKMVLRYSDAILAYASRLLPNREDAENVHFVIVHNMLEKRFSKEPVEKGRFRFYVKRAVRLAVYNYKRQRFREQSLLRRFWNTLFPRQDSWGNAAEELAVPPAEVALEEAELSIWRATVLSRAMEAALKALEDHEQSHQDRVHANVYHTLARLLMDHPADTSEQLAQRLSQQVGGAYNAGQTRGITMRMRKKLAELLMAEIIQQVDDPTYENVLDEMSELGLLAYVEPYLPPREPAPGGA